MEKEKDKPKFIVEPYSKETTMNRAFQSGLQRHQRNYGYHTAIRYAAMDADRAGRQWGKRPV